MIYLKHFLAPFVFLLIFSVIFCSCTTVPDTEHVTETVTEETVDYSLTEKDDTPSAVTVESTSEPHRNEAAEFFDDAVFVGDSVTLGLKNRAVAQRNKGIDYLGNAQFLCAGSLNFYSAAAPLSDPDAVHPAYKGQKVTVPEGIRLCGAEKIFIMLGMNDFCAFSENEWQKNIDTVLSGINAVSPDAEIYIQSVTPIVSGYERGSFNNEKIALFNEYLKSICADRNLCYVDISSAVADENGYLKTEYCGDLAGMGLHMSAEGADRWTEYLTELFDNNEKESLQ